MCRQPKPGPYRGPPVSRLERGLQAVGRRGCEKLDDRPADKCGRWQPQGLGDVLAGGGHGQICLVQNEEIAVRLNAAGRVDGLTRAVVG